MIWPRPKPDTLLGIMSLFLVGCVSIKTHEDAKITSYEAGFKEGCQRSLIAMQTMDSKEDAEFILKGFLAVEEMKK